MINYYKAFDEDYIVIDPDLAISELGIDLYEMML